MLSKKKNFYVKIPQLFNNTIMHTAKKPSYFHAVITL